MFVTFTGNPLDERDFHASVTITGVEFPLGVAVEVPSTPAFEKLRGNTHFTVTDSDDASSSDADGDYKDTVELSKADLIAEAEALGVEIDRRWSGKTIGEKIDAFIKAKSEAEQAEGQI